MQVSNMTKSGTVDFRNTSVAFGHMSDSELRKAYFLFKMLSYPSLTKLGPAFAGLSLKLRLPVKSLIKSTMFGQFCGGEDIEECSATIEKLGAAGIGTILDFATEACETEEDFERVKNEVKHTIELAQMNTDVPFAVFKPTGLGRISLMAKRDNAETLTENEKNEFDKIAKRFEEICQYAFDHNVRVLVDAEDSWIQNSVDELVENLMRRFNKNKAVVYNTVQLYRKDRLNYLKASAERAKADDFYVGVKLVRGAYLEKEGLRSKEMGYENPIQDSKKDTDRDYNRALEYCLDNLDRVSLVAGTHNEESTRLLINLMAAKSVEPSNSQIYFAQLLGMSDNLSYNLAKSGYNVCKYVPYGRMEELLPYLSRRAEENTSIQGQSGRELDLLKQEMKRRNYKKK